MTIRGGYASCTATESTGQTILDADGQDRIFDIWMPKGEDGPHSVVLENLLITNGYTSQSGGGVLIEGRPGALSVTLNNVRVENNESEANGGGVAVLINEAIAGHGGLVLVTDADTWIGSNVAGHYGGGLACMNLSGYNVGISNMMVIDRTNIIDNQATNGGGFAAVDCATIQWYSGGSMFLIVPDSAIFGNSATGSGGGIYLSDGSRMNFRGSSGTSSGISVGDLNAGRLTFNQADMGGGAYVTGPSTRLMLEDVIIDANSADDDGGGLFVNDRALVEMRRGPTGPTAPCQPSQSSAGITTIPRCSRLRNNTAGRRGGAAFVDGGELSVDYTQISGNDATTQGSVVTVRGTEGHPGQAIFSNSLVFGNSGNALFYAWTHSDLTVGWSTITDNVSPTSAVRAFTNTGSARVRLLGSIVHETTGDVVSAGGNGDFDVLTRCVMGHQHHSQIYGSWDRYQQNNPRLMEKDATRLHYPSPTSPVIDFCDGSTASNRDLAGRSRGSAHAGSPLVNPPAWSGNSPYDIGAYETNWPVLEDGIFQSRFE
ncbi:hypothetical protein IC757_12255 [Wenzhouxiangella sp. AB-CW3]|uniref:hypothetical protein n=1 Tax=Wenzhouxiangella sp. AB-CW3 TaxID=2771012 RepID=UPI00168BC250|nr:hypothetical protein [Wenzhouxiangella sp. AB-CW3]QOC21802.1 hypothetical protein IC757_12255 [Wenzhouxiangella sp. AB-CW3]